MFSRKYIFVLFMVFITTLGIFISSCDITDPTKGLEVRLNSITRETLVSAYVYDANTKNSIESNINITFTGANASKIVDITNDPKTQFSINNGILNFGIMDGVEISESIPFTVTVQLEADGYESRTESLKLLSKGIQTVDLFMNNLSTPAQGTDQGNGSGTTDNSGTTTSDVQVATSGGTSVTIPSGTNLGNLSGDISVNITTVPITAQNAYYVPQNLSVSSNQSLVPAVSINLNITDQNGNSSGNSVEVSMPIADGIVNPRTGTGYQSGDTMGFYKFNSSTGLWEHIGEGTVSGTLAKTMPGKIFAGLFLNGFIPAGGVVIAGNDETTCNATLTITNIPSGFNKSSIRFFNSSGNRMNPSNSGSDFLFEIPDGGTSIASIRINADLNDPFNTGTELGSNVILSCGNQSTSLNFPANLVSAKFDITGICTARDPQVVVYPSASFSYRKVGSQTWQSGSLSQGVATVNGLEVGATYEVTASYRDNTGNARVKVNAASSIDILDISNPENLLSSSVDNSTSPPTIKLTIDIGNDCD